MPMALASASTLLGVPVVIPLKTQMTSTNLERAGIVVYDRVLDAGLVEEGTRVGTRSVACAISEVIA
jgi:hypothetical protein